MTDYSIQIDEIRQAKSLEEIRGISRQFSAKATAEGGILYSRLVGNVNSEIVAVELAGKTGFPIINETPRASRTGVRVDFSKRTFRKITLTPVSFFKEKSCHS